MNLSKKARRVTGRVARSTIEHLESRRLLANDPLYVLAHGADLGDFSEDWMVDMAVAINDRNDFGFTRTQIEGSEFEREDVDPLDGTSLVLPSGSARNFILFNWDDVSGLDSPGTADSDAVAGRLATLVTTQLTEGKPRDVHLIGHSRGGYVVTDVARRLAGVDDQISFLQLTTLDAQAYASDGNITSSPSNVDWHDNYFQSTGLFDGFEISMGAIDGGFNLDLTEALDAWTEAEGGRADSFSSALGTPFSGNHSEVRDWYHWTIDVTDDGTPYSSDTQSLGSDPDATRELLYGGFNSDIDGDGSPDTFGKGTSIGFHYSRSDALERRTFAGFGGLDLVFVIDTTGSMSDDIAAVRDAVQEIVSNVEDVVPDFQIGIVRYSDFGDIDPVTETVVPLTSDIDEIVAGLDTISARGGGDRPEAVYSGLMHAIRMEQDLGGWRGGIYRKSVILFGDAPPKEPEPNTGYDKYDVSIAAFLADPVDIFGVAIGDNGDVVSSFGTISVAGGGDLIRAANSGDVVAAVGAAIGSIAGASEVDLDDASGILRVFGSGDDDVISVTRDGSVLTTTINGADTEFTASDVLEIQIEARAGNDSVSLGAGVGYAIIHGGEGDDTLTGSAGRDALYGDNGNDVLRGNAAGDLLDGGAGDDTLEGQDGDDTLQGGIGDDVLNAGPGVDAVSYLDRSDNVSIFLDAEDGTSGAEGESDTLTGFEQAIGGAGDDLIVGNVDANFLIGLAGDDTLSGGDGKDTLLGNDGADELRGGNDNDTLIALSGLFSDTTPDRLFGGGGIDIALADDDDDVDELGRGLLLDVSSYLSELT